MNKYLKSNKFLCIYILKHIVQYISEPFIELKNYVLIWHAHETTYAFRGNMIILLISFLHKNITLHFLKS